MQRWVVELGVEQCDDGNTADGDGCSAHCAIEEDGIDGGSCGLIAKIRQLSPVRPGKKIKLRVMWLDTCDDADDVEITTVLPAGTQLRKVKSGTGYTASGDTVTFHSADLKAGVVGRAWITVSVPRDTKAWTPLVVTVFASDGRGRVANSQTRTVVQTAKPEEFLRLYGPHRPMPNERIRYRAQYKSSRINHTLTLTMGPEVAITEINPPPTHVEDNVVTWDNLPAGKFKFTVDGVFVLFDNTSVGTILSANAALLLEDRYELRDNHATAADMKYLLQ